MRVVVISLDALEHDYVANRDFKGLKQKYYGKVSLEPYFTTRPEGIGGREPLTPHIYSIIFTGILPTKRNYETFNDFITEVKGGKHPTILDNAQKPFMVDAPVLATTINVNREQKSWLDRLTGAPLFSGYFRDVYTLEETLSTYYSYMRCKTDIVKLVDKQNNDLIFIYYKEPDKIQHILNDFKRDRDGYETLYNTCDTIAKELIETFDDGKTFIMVLSDHGVNMRGGHSEHAFWSTNMDIGYTRDIPIQDIYHIINKWVSTNPEEIDEAQNPITDEEKRLLAERLRKLGYVV